MATVNFSSSMSGQGTALGGSPLRVVEFDPTFLGGDAQVTGSGSVGLLFASTLSGTAALQAAITIPTNTPVTLAATLSGTSSAFGTNAIGYHLAATMSGTASVDATANLKTRPVPVPKDVAENGILATFVTALGPSRTPAVPAAVLTNSSISPRRT